MASLWGRFARCARAVRTVGYFGPISPDGHGDYVAIVFSKYRVPRHRTAQILTQSENADNELKQIMFPTENAGWLSQSAVLAPWT